MTGALRIIVTVTLLCSTVLGVQHTLRSMNARLASVARDCSTDAQCSGHGTCSNGLCTCSTGYGGAKCSKVCPGSTFAANGTATQVCSGHGSCVRQLAARCLCDEGYRLTDCSEKRPVPGEPSSVQPAAANESAISIAWEEPENAQTAATGDFTGAEYVVETCQVALGGCDDNAGLAQALVEDMVNCDMCRSVFALDAQTCFADCGKQWAGDCARACASAEAGRRAALSALEACRRGGLCSGTAPVQARMRAGVVSTDTATVETSNWRVACRVRSPPCVITSLSRGTAYKVRVRGKFRKSEFGSFSQVVQVATEASAPDYDTNAPLTNISVSDSSIVVRAVPPRDIGGGEVQARIQRYRIEFRPSGSGDPYTSLLVNATTENPTPNVTLSGLEKFTAYDIRLVAENVAGFGSPSPVVTQKTRGVCGDGAIQSGSLGNGLSYTEQCDGGHCCTSSCALRPSSHCSNNGQCVSGSSCSCNAGFVGTTCQYSNETTCSGNGIVSESGSCECFPGYAGASCSNVTAYSCQALREANGGSALGNGVFNITDGSAYYRSYCVFDGTSGYDVLFTLDSTDSVVREYDDTAFWEGGAAVGTLAGALSGEFKGDAYSKLPIREEIRIEIVHTDGRQVGYARYPVLDDFKEVTWLKLMQTSANTVVTGARSAGAQDTSVLSYTYNTERAQSLHGDPFLNHNHALKLNLDGRVFNADRNKMRIMTTVDNTDYEHTFAGIGGYHLEGGWGVRYEASPISSYCELRDAYGDSGQAGNSLAVSGEAYPMRDSCRNTATFKYTPVRIRVLAKGRPLCACYSLGSTGDSCPNGQCACKSGFTGERCDRCASGYFAFYDTLGRIASCSATITSCQEFKMANPSFTTGAATLQPGTGSYQSYCYVDGTKAFDLLFTLNTHDNTIRDFADTTFWTTASTVGAASNNPVLNEFKGLAFSQLKLANELMVSIQKNGAEQGRSTYNVLSSFQSKTLLQVLTENTAYTTITSARTSSHITSSLGLIRNPDRAQQLFGDLFIDHDEAVTVNKRGTHWGAAYAETRIATTLHNTQYGHTFAGLGGYHTHTSWGIYYEAAPISAYCDIRQSYGDSTKNGNAHSISGKSYPYGGTCPTSHEHIPIEVSVWAR